MMMDDNEEKQQKNHDFRDHDYSTFWEKHTKGVGSRLLNKYGFSGRLGAREDGIDKPITVTRNISKSGLGFRDPFSKPKDEDTLTSKMKGLELQEVEGKEEPPIRGVKGMRALWDQFFKLCYQFKDGSTLESQFIAALDLNTVVVAPEVVGERESRNVFVEYWDLFEPLFDFIGQHPVNITSFDPDIVIKLRRLKRFGYLPFTSRASVALPSFDFSDPAEEEMGISSPVVGKKRGSYDARSRVAQEAETERKEAMRKQKLSESLKRLEAEDDKWWLNIDLLIHYYEVHGTFDVPLDFLVIRDDETILELGRWLHEQKSRLPHYYLRDYERYSALTDLMAQGLWTES